MTASPHVHDNALRGRFNAAFFTVLGGYVDWLLRRPKAAVLDDLGHTVVEIGPGVGANLRHYRRGTRLIAVEPNLRMHAGLRRNAEAAGVDLTVLTTGAEAIDLPDASVTDVVSTLVLCTVTDPHTAISEIHRVLRSGGRFRFVEHVAAPSGTLVRRVQRLIRRPWKWVFEGCHVERDTAELVADAGFAALDIEPFRMRSPFVPANPGVAGIAVR